MNPESKSCFKCKAELPIDEFGVCRSRPDGRNAYCKPCIRAIVNAGRQRIREMEAKQKAAHAAQEIKRKHDVISPRDGTPMERVQEAMCAGYRTRNEIELATKLSMDQVCDLLAELVAESAVRIERVDGDAWFYSVRAA